MENVAFEHHVQKERERLTKERESTLVKRAEIDAQIEKIDRELTAINAYENAKNGTPPNNRKSGTRRIGRRSEVLEAIKKHASGISRSDLMKILGAHDNKEKMSVSNALSALKRSKKITQGTDDKYQVVVPSSSSETTMKV